MPIPVKCPECEARFNVADEQAGKSVRCAECGGTIRVPDAGAEGVTARPGAVAPPSVPSRSRDADPAPRPRKRAQGSGALGALAIVGGVLLLLFLVCGGGLALGGYLVWTSWERPHQVAVIKKPIDQPMPMPQPQPMPMPVFDGMKKDIGFDKKIDPFPGPPIVLDGMKKDFGPPPFDNKDFKGGFGPGPGVQKNTALSAPATQITLGPDGSFRTSNIVGAGDPRYVDFMAKPCKVYQVQMEAGRRYQIDMAATWEFDAYLYLYNPQGQVVAQDDDGGRDGVFEHGHDSRIIYTAPQTGVFRIYAMSLGGRTGNFTLAVRRQ